MARELESKETGAVVASLLVPGAGHLIVDQIPVGLVLLVAAGAAAWVMPPLWFVVGLIAAVHLFTSLRAEVEEPHRVTLPPKPKGKLATQEPAPEAKPEKVEPKAEPKREAIEVSEAKAEPEKVVSAEPETPAKVEPVAEPKPKAKPVPVVAPKPEPKPITPIPAAQFPQAVDKLDKRLPSLKGAMEVAQQWHATHLGMWNPEPLKVTDGAPSVLVEVAEALGGVRFEAFWSHGWEFAYDDVVSLFNVVDPVDIGWRFGHRDDARALELIWKPDGAVVRRQDGNVTELAPSLEGFLDQLQEGFRVAQMSLAAEALMDPKQLNNRPAAEKPDDGATADVEFGSFWLGAEGPGLHDVWYEIAPPWIEHSEGSRVADAMDAALIDAFAEWLDTNPPSPDGAMELAEQRSAYERPVAWIKRDDKVLVAWWVESPPEEVDAFLDHLRSLTYWKN